MSEAQGWAVVAGALVAAVAVHAYYIVKLRRMFAQSAGEVLAALREAREQR